VLHDLGKEKSEKTFIDFNGIEKNYENKLDEYVEEIAKLARIDEFYHRLGDKKFETEIGERGIKLSGGERQRIGIARAIIKNPAILIFDEATSALDTVNEKYIKEAIDNVSKGRTTIIIAHRLSTVIDSDIIFVMNLGKVVASGTHAYLLESSEYYQELIKHQDLK
jgi:ABC-type multidrug transport system fused ATPase/permease subunit